MVCDWWVVHWISIRFVCFCVSRFVACDPNYDWGQRKTQLWRRLMNFRVRMFVESAVTVISLFQETTRLFETRVKIKLRDTPSAKGYAAKSSQSSIVLLGNRGTLISAYKRIRFSPFIATDARSLKNLCVKSSNVVDIFKVGVLHVF